GGRPTGHAAAELPSEALSGSIEERVEGLLQRLRDAIVEEDDPESDHGLSNSVLDLPLELRTAVLGKLVAEASSDPLAERLIRSMTNAELTRALVDLGDGAG